MFDVRIYNAIAGTRGSNDGIEWIPFIKSGDSSDWSGVLSEREWFTPIIEIRVKSDSVSGTMSSEDHAAVVSEMDGNLAAAPWIDSNYHGGGQVYPFSPDFHLDSATSVRFVKISVDPAPEEFLYYGNKTIFQWRFIVWPFSYKVFPGVSFSAMNFNLGSLEIKYREFHLDYTYDGDTDSWIGSPDPAPDDPDEWTAGSEIDLTFTADEDITHPDPLLVWDYAEKEDWATPWSDTNWSAVNTRRVFVPHIIHTMFNSPIGPLYLANKPYVEATSDPDYNPFPIPP